MAFEKGKLQTIKGVGRQKWGFICSLHQHGVVNK